MTFRSVVLTMSENGFSKLRNSGIGAARVRNLKVLSQFSFSTEIQVPERHLLGK